MGASSTGRIAVLDVFENFVPSFPENKVRTTCAEAPSVALL